MTQEQFFAITRLGAKHIDRVDEYVWRNVPKSPMNIMHESMVRDVGLSFLRYFTDYEISITYNRKIFSIRPDLFVLMKHYYTNQKYIFLIEIERKKSPDRVIREKLCNYEKVLTNINFKESELNAPVKVLYVFATIDYNPFLRPQEYHMHKLKLQRQEKLVFNLARRSNVNPNRYLFLPFYNFHRIHHSIWYMPNGKQKSVLL